MSMAVIINRIWARLKTIKNRVIFQSKKIARMMGLKIRPVFIFDVLSLTKLRHMEPIIRRLKTDDLVSLIIVGPQPVINYCRSMHVSCLSYQEFEKSITLKADIFLSTDFHRKPNWLTSAKFCYVTHGTSPKLNYAASNLYQCDLVMAPGKIIYDAQRDGISSSAKIWKVGLPVTDQFFEHEQQEQRGTDGRLKILYAPTWNSIPGEISISQHLLRELSNLRDCDVLVRPHPNLLDPALCNGVDWRSAIKSFEGETFRMVDDEDVSTYSLMRHSDILVGDVSSVVYEYMLLQKPVLLESCAEFFTNNDCESERPVLENAATVVNRAIGLDQNIQKTLSDAGQKKNARRSLISRYFFNVGNATGVAVGHLYKEVGIGIVWQDHS